jgi:hypothetical protein
VPPDVSVPTDPGTGTVDPGGVLDDGLGENKAPDKAHMPDAADADPVLAAGTPSTATRERGLPESLVSQAWDLVRRSPHLMKESAATAGSVLRDAAIETARTFAIPILLTAATLAFLLIQAWASRRDPRLALAPVDGREDLVEFI